MIVERIAAEGRLLARDVGYFPKGNRLEHALDDEIRRRMAALSGTPTLDGRAPIEAATDIQILLPEHADAIFGFDELDDHGFVPVRSLAERDEYFRQIRERCRAVCQPMTLHQAVLILRIAKRWDTSPRALADLFWDVWPWAVWQPTYNHLIGTELFRTASNKAAAALGDALPYPEE